MLRIDILRIVRVENGYVYCEEIDNHEVDVPRQVRFQSDGWPIQEGDIVSVEYDIEIVTNGKVPELVDIEYMRVYDELPVSGH